MLQNLNGKLCHCEIWWKYDDALVKYFLKFCKIVHRLHHPAVTNLKMTETKINHSACGTWSETEFSSQIELNWFFCCKLPLGTCNRMLLPFDYHFQHYIFMQIKKFRYKTGTKHSEAWRVLHRTSFYFNRLSCHMKTRKSIRKSGMFETLLGPDKFKHATY